MESASSTFGRSPIAAYAVGSPEAALQKLGSRSSGLTDAEAADRLVRFGPNGVGAHGVRWTTVLLRQFRSPFVYLLLGAAGLSFLLRQPVDAFLILVFVFLNAGLGFYQEYHAERTVQLLARFIESKVRVRRGGRTVTVLSQALVPGDILLLQPGDLLAADVRFLGASDLVVNESVLTGESAPVNKSERALTSVPEERTNATDLGFAGTTVVSGEAEAVVAATGHATGIAGIAELASGTQRVTGYDKELARFSRFTLQLIAVTLVLLVAANVLIRGHRTNIGELLLFSIALAVGVTPEGLPLVTTFALSRGAQTLAKRKVVVKRLAAVEDLGSIEVLCTDKTGTLTENRLSVAATLGVERAVLQASALAGGPVEGVGVNPFDTAVHERMPKDLLHALRGFRVVHEIPFDPDRRRNTVLVQGPKGFHVISRGAPEAVFALVDGFTPAHRRTAEQWVADQGMAGNRVLAVAERPLARSTDRVASAEHGLHLTGLIAFADPIKPTTAHAVHRAQALGIEIKILTGDGPAVAGAVGHAIGLAASPDEVITGRALEALPPPEQHAAVERYRVFARMSPEQKFAVLQLLREKRTVGFLGEGINDAPALKAADVGMVVAGAADVAREAADIVLLNRSLDVIVEGIGLGRRVFANVTKYITATLASNFGNFYAVAIASLTIPFLPMLPLQILLLNLLSDFPMISIATDTVDPRELVKPRRYDVRGLLLTATVFGVVSTVFDFVFFGIFVRSGAPVLQTMWFVGSVLTELVFVFSVRTRRFLLFARRPSIPILLLTLVAAVVTLALPFTAFARSVFHFIRPSAGQLGLVLGIAAAYLITTEVVKLAYYRLLRRSGPPQRTHAFPVVR